MKEIPLSSSMKKIPVHAWRRSVLDPKTCSLWTRHLGQMLGAGVPLVTAIESLAAQSKTKRVQHLFLAIAELVNKGEQLSDALMFYSSEFDLFYINSIRAGEASGRLDVVLCRLADYLDATVQAVKKVKAACLYPAIVASFTLLVVLFLVAFVVPKMQNVINNMGEQVAIPWLAKQLMCFSLFLQDHGLMFMITSLAVSVIFFFLVSQCSFQLAIERLAFNLPKVGLLMKQWSAVRLAGMLELLLKSGIPLFQAITFAQGSIKSRMMRRDLQSVQYQMLNGISFSEAVQLHSIFPITFIQMVLVGEESGLLADTLGTVAHQYGEEINESIDTLITWIEPALILFLALIIGLVVIAFFLPMVGILESLGGL